MSRLPQGLTFLETVFALTLAFVMSNITLMLLLGGSHHLSKGLEGMKESFSDMFSAFTLDEEDDIPRRRQLRRPDVLEELPEATPVVPRSQKVQPYGMYADNDWPDPIFEDESLGFGAPLKTTPKQEPRGAPAPSPSGINKNISFVWKDVTF